jgi:hypothetical protein
MRAHKPGVGVLFAGEQKMSDLMSQHAAQHHVIQAPACLQITHAIAKNERDTGRERRAQGGFIGGRKRPRCEADDQFV